MAANLHLATNSKPCLGFKSKGAAIISLREQGMTHTEIGRILDMSPRAVSSLFCRTKQRMVRSARAIHISANLFLDLEREAQRRGMDVDVFARKLLETIVVDKLYSAVMD